MAGELTQESFLGCSIRSFNFNMGWGNAASVLNVGLVEDDALFQRMGLLEDGQQKHYVDPIGLIGQLTRFNYSGWIFDGIVANVYEQKSDSGNRVWDVNLTDPRELLDGVQIILSGYSGFTYSVPNLYNVYGYLESFGFGRSQSNDAGIPWNLAVQAIDALVTQSPIYLAGVPFFIDLSGLPSLPNYYRIPGNTISLLGLIQDVCQTANFEFTCVLQGNTIRVLCIDRNTGYLNGALTRFLQSVDGYNSVESGFELQYNTTNKFLVGPQVEQVYYQFNAVGPNMIGANGKRYNPTYDDTIARYWGTNAFGNVVVAQREALMQASNQYDANETFIVDGTPISCPGIPWYQYPIDIAELRAAMVSRGNWEWFLTTYDDGKIAPIHKGKATRLKMNGDTRMKNLASLGDIKKCNISDIVKFDANLNISEQHEAYLEKVYRFVQNFATQYLGLKFMVKIPFVYASLDGSTGQITTSLQPTETGYIDESLYNQAIANGLMPNFTDFVTTPEGKIMSYVRFGPFKYEELDLSALSEDDYYISGPYLFVKCEVDPKIVYLDRTTQFSPRVVITLPGPILFSNEFDILNMMCQAYVNEIVFEGLKSGSIGPPPGFAGFVTTLQQLEEFYKAAGMVPTKKAYNASQPPPKQPAQISAYEQYAYDKVEELKKDFTTWKKQVGAEYAFMTMEPVSLIPSMAAIPIRNNMLTYGPWYSSGFQGRVEFEQNYDMNPWSFGGFANLSQAGNAVVSSVYTNTMIGESGSITLPGVPALQPGTQLVTSGPMVTQIDVSVGLDGVVTTYRLGRWNATYGKQISENIENFKKIFNLKKEQARAFRSLFKPKVPPDAANTRFGTRSLPKPRRINPATSHAMLISTTYEKTLGYQGNNIGSVPYYHVQNVADGDWEKIAGCSYDGLFRPYSTKFSVSGMPHFTDPSGYRGGDSTVNDLNPFKEGHDIKVAFRGASGTVDINNPASGGPADDYRSIALKAPVILCGWGKDINGGVVPNYNTMQNQQEFKTGPLDVKWDEERGVWGHGLQFYEGILTSDIIAPTNIAGMPTTFRVDVFGGPGRSGFAHSSGNTITCTNRDPSLAISLFPPGNINYSGKVFVMAMRMGDEIRPFWVGCPELIP